MAALRLSAHTSGSVLTSSKGAPQTVDAGQQPEHAVVPKTELCVAADTAGNVVVGSR